MSNFYKLQVKQGRIRRYVMRPTGDGKGEIRTDIGGQEYQAEVFIDPAALGYLCNRAALNKSGKLKAGPVHIKIISRNDTP